jgi:site-specific recombinase XerD
LLGRLRKFWLAQVEGQDKTFVELRPKKREQLPRVRSVEEVKRLFAVIDNLKHRCILKIIYDGGRRRSEVVNLHLEDIQSDRLQVFVQGGMGKKDWSPPCPLNFLASYARNYSGFANC